MNPDQKQRPIAIINSVAPIRICDNGGWTDTWFAGGTRITPRVLERIDTNADDSAMGLEPATATLLPQTTPGHWDDVVEAMVQVVENPRGTAKRIRSEDFRIAGKTGTAQVFTVKQDEKYEEDEVPEKMRDHALFIAFAPVEEPRIAVAVIVEHGGHGGAVAAPIARIILDYHLVQKTL